MKKERARSRSNESIISTLSWHEKNEDRSKYQSFAPALEMAPNRKGAGAEALILETIRGQAPIEELRVWEPKPGPPQTPAP